MGRYIVKPVAERDFYVEYSTIVDNWVSCGTREDMVRYGLIDETRLDRADATGSSSWPGFDSFASREKYGSTGMLFRGVGDKCDDFEVPWESIEPLLREWQDGVESETPEEQALYEKHGVLWEPWKDEEEGVSDL